MPTAPPSMYSHTRYGSGSGTRAIGVTPNASYVLHIQDSVLREMVTCSVSINTKSTPVDLTAGGNSGQVLRQHVPNTGLSPDMRMSFRERLSIWADVVKEARQRLFFGICRAKGDVSMSWTSSIGLGKCGPGRWTRVRNAGSAVESSLAAAHQIADTTRSYTLC